MRNKQCDIDSTNKYYYKAKTIMFAIAALVFCANEHSGFVRKASSSELNDIIISCPGSYDFLLKSDNTLLTGPGGVGKFSRNKDRIDFTYIDNFKSKVDGWIKQKSKSSYEIYERSENLPSNVEEPKPIACTAKEIWRNPAATLLCSGQEMVKGIQSQSTFHLNIDAFGSWQFDGNRNVAGAIPSKEKNQKYIVVFRPPRGENTVEIGKRSGFRSMFAYGSMSGENLHIASMEGDYNLEAKCNK